ncbi:MAG: class I tRNA ligase family protein, partial [Archaeoglobaceae archaeon]|nr:class I tRNA ligase family protein [Archaeoglobaceae archaeon]
KRQVKDVLDVWFDSGVASWGSIGYPLKNDKFDLWPADFITEGHDQTRGWFYSQLGVSLLCFDRAPYKTVLMHGFTLDEQGRKMSKSLGNVVEPEEVISQIGIDCFRLYVLSSAIWEDLKFSWEEARNVLRNINILWNTIRFAHTYMSLDNFKPGKKVELSFEDRWILSRLERFNEEAVSAMEKYQLHRVVKSFFEFVVEDFSRWYIPLIRARVWEEAESQKKISAYETMFYVIDKVLRIIAPFAPLLTEWLYQNFVKNFREGKESIFMEEYPKPEKNMISPELEEKMRIARAIVEAGSSARSKAKIKLRWPLREMIVETNIKGIEMVAEVIVKQSNVKEVKFVEKFHREIIIKPDFKKVGPILKDKAKKFAEYVSKMKEVPEVIDFEGIKIGKDCLIIEERISEDYVFADFPGGRVYINIKLDDELLKEAYAREIVRRIQQMRKEMNLNVEEFIVSYVEIDPKILEGWEEYVKNETRSKDLKFKNAEGYVKDWEIEDLKVRIGIKKWS